MVFGSIFLLGLGLLSTCEASPLSKRSPAPFTDFVDNFLFRPASDSYSWGDLYGRTLQMSDGSLLMTWENYPVEPPLIDFPIFRSTDGGATWSNYSSVKDQVNGWGMRYQPFLYTLPRSFGNYAAGTILATGVSVNESLTGGAYIDLYASTDDAITFNFVSHIAHGNGPEVATNGDEAIWEPFLLTYGDELICYFSDQRDPDHGQKLTHVTTTDLTTWTSNVDDVVYPGYQARPGMATVSYIDPIDKYIMTYEFCGTGYSCNVTYKLAENPKMFGKADGINLYSTSLLMQGSPYNIFTTDADGQGVVLVGSNSQSVVFANSVELDPYSWRTIEVGMQSSYSRSMRVVILEGKRKLMFGTGGNMTSYLENGVACGIVEIPSYPS